MDCVYEVVQTNRAPCGTVRWDPLRFGERNYLGPQRENFAFNDFCPFGGDRVTARSKCPYSFEQLGENCLSLEFLDSRPHLLLVEYRNGRGYAGKNVVGDKHIKVKSPIDDIPIVG